MTTNTITEPSPTIVCPDWCVIPTEEHLRDLEALENSVVHISEDQAGDGWVVGHSRCSHPDGRISEDDPPQISLHARDGLNIDQAQAFVAATLTALKEMTA